MNDLHQLPIADVRGGLVKRFTQHPGLGELLDAKVEGRSPFTKPVVFHDGEDEVTLVTGYGDGQKPEDYLNAFNTFINVNSNRMAAIQTIVKGPVCRRSWSMSRITAIIRLIY